MGKTLVRAARAAATVTTTAMLTIVVLAGPALAQQAKASKAKPWFYWIAPLLLAGALFVLAGFFVNYYLRVLRDRGPRG